jgi:hypothetical protein
MILTLPVRAAGAFRWRSLWTSKNSAHDFYMKPSKQCPMFASPSNWIMYIRRSSSNALAYWLSTQHSNCGHCFNIIEFWQNCQCQGTSNLGK